ncbi:hypothetical protein LYNGBM3L_25110 [Moorena producens 3L]|uniref:Uncharacterized protein n=1 Tax=Moorena producens 3L TaxID=489825 RepID=F4XNP8_9CYAN|nr:hypothetical protein LYNGBM3L_25110 [Moorena producens 3L]
MRFGLVNRSGSLRTLHQPVINPLVGSA